MTPPDPRQLRYFLAVVEKGSLSGAAEALNISEPALSKSIRLLEQSLKVQLLERHSRGMVPTVFGRALAEHARVIRSELRHALNEINALRGSEKGQVVAGAFPSFNVNIMPRAVGRLLAERPGLRVSVYEALADKMMPMTLSGDLDFCVMTMRPFQLDPGLQQEPLLPRERGVAVMNPKHALAKRGKLGLKEFKGEKWILPPQPDRLRLEFEQLFVSARLTPPEPTVECNSALFIRSMLMHSDCVSYLPKQLVLQEIERGVLAFVEIDASYLQGEIGFIYRRRGILSPASRALMEEIRTICKEYGGKPVSAHLYPAPAGSADRVPSAQEAG
jgi:DNA-binding transcriptional LysR family regulator